MLTYTRFDYLEVKGYNDSDYGGCLDDFKPTSRCIFMLVEGFVSWKSFKQTLIATSTIEAEYIACYKATHQEIWLKKFIVELSIVESVFRPLTIYCDNSIMVWFSRNNKTTKRSKHFDIQFMFIEDKIQEFQTRIEHIPTELIIADPLTKGLTVKAFVGHVTRMGVMRSFEVLVYCEFSFMNMYFHFGPHVLYCSIY